MGAAEPLIPAPFWCRQILLKMTGGVLDGADVDHAYEVVAEADFAVIGRVESSRESLRFQLAGPDAVLEEHRLVEDERGRPVGLLVVERDPVARRFYIDAYCTPGLEATVLDRLVAMGIDAGSRLCDEEPGWDLEACVFEPDTASAGTLRAHGYRMARRFWQMRIDLAGYPQAEPPAPPGVTRTIAWNEADRRILHAVHDAAFSEHFGSVAHSYEDWLAGFGERQDAAPDLWWLASLNGEPVAEITQDNSREAVNGAYVRTLGVVPKARGLGIGRWLLECAFADAARRGREWAILTVDSDNTTGATALYESAGMAADAVMEVYRRPLGRQ
jgi:mycothiol synthase